MTLEVLSNLERKLNFNIDKAIVTAGVEIKLRKYAKDAKIQGFRPGKAPKNVVEQMYGARAYEDSLNDQLNKQFVDLLVEHKLNIVGYPKFDLTSSEGEEFIFAATFEVMPEVKLGDLSTVEVEKPLCSLTDANVQATIDVLRKQRATHEVSDSAAATDDKVTIDFLGTVDGVEFDGGKAEDYSFVLGQGMMLVDFETGILGLKSGESKDVTVAFPADYHAENLKGKSAVFKITVKEVAKQVLPALDAEFIQSVGVELGTEEALRNEIKDNLQKEINRRLKLKARDNALKALSDSSPLDVPSAMVHDEIHHMMKTAEENMKKQGYKPEQIKLTHEMFEKDARNMVVLRMLVQEFIKENDIHTTDDEVKQTVQALADMYEDPIDYVAWYYQDEQRVNNAKAITMEQKVTDTIYAKAKAKEVELSYEDIMKMPVQY